MLFNSLHFLIFFPIVVMLYYAIPQKMRYMWLLIASYYFYMSWNVKYVILLLTSTVVTYLGGLLVSRLGTKEENINRTKEKWCVFVTLFINLGILFFFKYFNFFLDSLNAVLQRCNINLIEQQFSVLLPVGISFYTFQALSYTIDVYRKEIEPENNFFRYALFVSFFPQLVAGPIERSKNLLTQLRQENKPKFDQFREGILLMLWGYFLKLVIADRVAIVVDTVYGDVEQYAGVYLIVASVLFAFQIYCDFYGYSIIAKGAALILGIELMENFRSPYLARNVAQFWRKWHISLSSWFKDYLYIPLGGNRKGRWRKFANIMIVFATSGLWHGANWTYVIWGALNGLFQIIGALCKGLRQKCNEVLGLEKEAFSHKLFEIVVTFALVDFAWIFFRASSLTEAITIIKSIFTVHNPWILFDGSLYNLGISQKAFQLMIYALMVLFGVDVANEMGYRIRTLILKQEAWFQILFYVLTCIMILVFGIWGAGYDSANFIYFQF